MPKIIAREREEKELETAFQSTIPEFIALYGRRRVGKTYLVRNFFENKEDTLFFTMTGTKEGTLPEQTLTFSELVADTFYRPGAPGAPVDIRTTWRDAFRLLTEQIRICPQKKIVLFFDEFPWMATRGSRLLRILEFFWNHYWSQDPRIKIIICGSSSSWILKNIVNNQGGLYNRVTRTIHLEPFNLRQTKLFLNHMNVKLNHRDITDIYMAMGGIPFYLSKITPGYSAAQAIEHLAFQRNSFLLQEFPNLYGTLFEAEGAHIELVRIIAEHRYGIGQAEIVKKAERFSSGGRIVAWLSELEQAGFIAQRTPFGRKKKGIYYVMNDEYSLFYFKWLEPIKKTLLEEGETSGYWELQKNSPSWNSWSGYAFESVCLKHIRQIRESLGLPRTALAYTWRYAPTAGSDEKGAQIDLLFDRADNGITLCDIKYSRTPFVLDKAYAEKLQRQITVFKEQTNTTKNICIAFVAPEGLKKLSIQRNSSRGCHLTRSL